MAVEQRKVYSNNFPQTCGTRVTIKCSRLLFYTVTCKLYLLYYYQCVKDRSAFLIFVRMATGTSSSTPETSSAVIESVMDTESNSGGQASTKDSKPVIKNVDKKATAPAVQSDTTTSANKDDNNDIVSQTTSGSAPVSVISSAQSMDPSKKDSGKCIVCLVM